ncbi:MAG: hypothetical protein GF347_05365, partial [Candidatus Moranbacteria bacterium]|nr:hypothetical protein [Candidatus Moranbacteria bacterium]
MFKKGLIIGVLIFSAVLIGCGKNEKLDEVDKNDDKMEKLEAQIQELKKENQELNDEINDLKKTQKILTTDNQNSHLEEPIFPELDLSQVSDVY